MAIIGHLHLASPQSVSALADKKKAKRRGGGRKVNEDNYFPLNRRNSHFRFENCFPFIYIFARIIIRCVIAALCDAVARLKVAFVQLSRNYFEANVCMRWHYHQAEWRMSWLAFIVCNKSNANQGPVIAGPRYHINCIQLNKANERETVVFFLADF